MSQRERDEAYSRRDEYEQKVWGFVSVWRRVFPADVQDHLVSFAARHMAERDILERELANARRTITRVRRGA